SWRRGALPNGDGAGAHRSDQAGCARGARCGVRLRVRRPGRAGDGAIPHAAHPRSPDRSALPPDPSRATAAECGGSRLHVGPVEAGVRTDVASLKVTSLAAVSAGSDLAGAGSLMALAGDRNARPGRLSSV